MAQPTIQNTFQCALEHHRAGRLDLASEFYQQVLAQEPEHAGAKHHLGVIAYQRGDDRAAVDLIGRAIELQPDYAEAHSDLGVVLTKLRRIDDAIIVLRRAIALRPNSAEAHNNLGNALRKKGQFEEAIEAYRRAIEVRPNFAEAYSNVGVVLTESGRFNEAVAAHAQAIALKSDYREAYSNLAIALARGGQLDAAIAAYRDLVARWPHQPEEHNNLGKLLSQKGEPDQAIAAFQEAIRLSPEFAGAYCNLGNALRDKGRLDEAVGAYRRAIELNPNLAEAFSNLGVALGNKGQLDEAIAAYRRAIELNPNFAQAFNNLGDALKDCRQLDEAIAAMRRATLLDPGNASLNSNLVYVLHLHPDHDAEALAEEHRLWNARHAEPLRQHILTHRNDRDPERRLRIGYISPDFRQHPVGRFLMPLLARHDKNRVEVYAYSRAGAQDEITHRLRSFTDVWRNCLGLSDAQAAELIREDHIDILVDLSMHMMGNSMGVFARKPAPIQVTYLAYCSTTGLATMDYRLSDPYLDPPGMEDSYYSERTVRLAETYWCYEPLVTSLEVGVLPALARGAVTFGCLNNFCKVSQPVLRAWAELLRAVPDSRLLLSGHEGSYRQRVLEQFETKGIKSGRVRFVEKVPLLKYLQLYREIDIALDTFPYAGGTTTCDALWMGVPVVSLVGRTAVGRGGLSILSNVGLPELAARTQEDYVRLAGELAHDLPRLSQLRSGLRRRMEQSPLMNAPRFAGNVEAAYREVWRKWCEVGKG